MFEDLEKQLQFELDAWASLLVMAQRARRPLLAAQAAGNILAVLFTAELYHIDLIVIR